MENTAGVNGRTSPGYERPKKQGRRYLSARHQRYRHHSTRRRVETGEVVSWMEKKNNCQKTGRYTKIKQKESSASVEYAEEGHRTYLGY